MAKNDLDLQMEDYQYLPLRDVVFRTLRQAILRGELKPGERLMEIRLANQLGVSRTPIREAIRMLELDGLVIMVPRKGAQVAQITEKDLNDVLEVRLGLEELAVKLACERITEEELRSLYQASRSFEKLIETETDDLQKLAQADVDFHDVIYQATNNERLIQLLNIHASSSYFVNIVPMPSFVSISIRIACGTRPSMMNTRFTPHSIAFRQHSAFGTMPP